MCSGRMGWLWEMERREDGYGTWGQEWRGKGEGVEGKGEGVEGKEMERGRYIHTRRDGTGRIYAGELGF